MTVHGEENIVLLKKFLSSVEKSDWNTLEENIHKDFQFVVGQDDLCLNKANFIAFYKSMLKACPNWSYGPRNFVADSKDSVMVEMNIKATNTGPWTKIDALEYESFEATGKEIVLPAEMNAFAIKDGKVALKAVAPVEGAGLHSIFVQLGKAIPRTQSIANDEDEFVDRSTPSTCPA